MTPVEIAHSRLDAVRLAGDAKTDARGQDKTTSSRKLMAVRASSVKPEKVTSIWDGRIYVAKVNEIIGDPGLGKSTIGISIAAAVSSGGALPGTAALQIGTVLIFSAEDGIADTIVPRLMAHGANLDRCEICPFVVGADNAETLPSLPEDIDLIEQKVKETGATLVIIDPFAAFLSTKLNANSDQDVRRCMGPVGAMTERTGATVLFIRHPNKNASSSAISRGGGSIGITAAARSSMVVGKDQKSGELVLAPMKSNLGPKASALSYRIVGDPSGAARIEWLGESDATADQLLAAPKDPDKRSALERAEGFLLDQLTNGSVPQTELIGCAHSQGISEKTLRRAKTRLNARAFKNGFGEDSEWRWELTTKTDTTPIPQELATFVPTTTTTITSNIRHIGEGGHEGGHSHLEGGQNTEGAQPAHINSGVAHEPLRGGALSELKAGGAEE